MGIEPTPSAWKAEVLPLNYTRPDAAARPKLPTEPGFHSNRKPASLRALASPVRPIFPVVVGEGFEPSKA
jgi:hypothetical protein